MTFEHLASHRIPSMNIEVQEYRHTGTGARHFHLACEDTNNAFLVAFPTVPQDSTGVAHILEHTTLCGSAQFPVRDPFFMMTRRSLNTFMNAYTSSDVTAYPFATQNPKDFDNLLQVYLDAVFFPRLDALDFAQEGCRLEFLESENPDSELVYKGVVFNEMKGAMGAPVTQLWQYLQTALFPTNTYHYNSGGEPTDIPNLSWEQLKAFHASHYHPSNAVILTYGSFPVEQHQARIHELALSKFEQRSFDFSIPDEQRYSEPFKVDEVYPMAAASEQELQGHTHIVMGWLLGRTDDQKALMHAGLLSGALLDNSASPLRHLLETCGLGSAPSDLCGLDDSMQEAVFVCGLEGSDAEQAELMQQQVLEVLEDVAEQGLPEELLASVLHQIELEQRQIRSGREPYGIQIMWRLMSAILHGAEPESVLDIDPVLEDLQQQIKDPNFIKSLVRRLLLDNPHRVLLVMEPDADKSARDANAEKQRLAEVKANLSEQQQQQIIEQAIALKQRQQSLDDPELLPRVGREDVPHGLKIVKGESRTTANMPSHWYAQGTNGILHEKLIIEVPALTPEEIGYLPVFWECLTEVGLGAQDYMKIQTRQANTGIVSSSLSIRASVDDENDIKARFILAGEGLVRNQQAISQLLVDTLHEARFDEQRRLREIVAQMRSSADMSITNAGHSLAMLAASSGMGPIAQLHSRWDGLQGIRYLQKLDDSLDSVQHLKHLADILSSIRDKLAAAPRELLIVSEGSDHTLVAEGLERVWADYPAVASNAEGFQYQTERQHIQQAWVTSTPVNFCSQAYAAITPGHADAPILSVLGKVLTNGYLHGAIREQGGAYGGGAGYDPDSASFRFFSYRDPRMSETLQDFGKSLDWLNGKPGERELEEGILGTVKQLDMPESPAGEAIRAHFNAMHGRSPEFLNTFRNRVLDTTLDDLRRVSETWLVGKQADTAIICNTEAADSAADLQLETRTI